MMTMEAIRREMVLVNLKNLNTNEKVKYKKRQFMQERCHNRNKETMKNDKQQRAKKKHPEREALLNFVGVLNDSKTFSKHHHQHPGSKTSAILVVPLDAHDTHQRVNQDGLRINFAPHELRAPVLVAHSKAGAVRLHEPTRATVPVCV